MKIYICYSNISFHWKSDNFTYRKTTWVFLRGWTCSTRTSTLDPIINIYLKLIPNELYNVEHTIYELDMSDLSKNFGIWWKTTPRLPSLASSDFFFIKFIFYIRQKKSDFFKSPGGKMHFKKPSNEYSIAYNM